MTGPLKPYPQYKPSGIEWLGDVPTHWEMRRTKSLLKERSQKGFPNEPLLAATQTKGVVRKEHYENRTVLALRDLHLLKLVYPGDFVISLRSFQGGIEYARDRGIISPAYTILYPENPDIHGYLAWLFKSKPYIENLTFHVTGIRQGQNIDYGRLCVSKIPLPPLSEQTAIVRYLDQAGESIRRYVSSRERLIELLEEYRQAVIHHAVTHGLDPDVRLKSSGVEWLGDVPAHWEVVALKRLGHFSSGTGFPISVQGQQKQELPFFKVSDMTLPNNHKVMRSWNNSVSRSTAARLGAKIFPSGTIVFPKVGGALLTNKRRVVERPCCIDNNLMGCIVHRGNPQFVLILLEHLDLATIAKPGPVPAISESEIREIRTVIPPIPEQAAIVAYFDKATADVDVAIGRARREIELLGEYRTRLIADVVTGQVDVREAAAELSKPVFNRELYTKEPRG